MRQTLLQPGRHEQDRLHCRPGNRLCLPSWPSGGRTELRPGAVRWRPVDKEDGNLAEPVSVKLSRAVMVSVVRGVVPQMPTAHLSDSAETRLLAIRNSRSWVSVSLLAIVVYLSSGVTFSA